MSIYLDNNGTTPLKPCVKALIAESLDVFGNPSSAHREGQNARMAVDHARRLVAQSVGVRSEQVVFTATGTESNVLAMRGFLMASPHKRLITTATEHSSVYNTAKSLEEDGVDVVYLPVDKSGVISLEALEQELKQKPTSLVCIMAANNETGVKQPVQQIANLCEEYGAFYHVDAVQTLAKEEINFPALGADSLSLSFHKIGGPKGVGALILKNEVEMKAVMTGGGQERNRRAGTENVLGIIGAGAACEKIAESIADMPRLKMLQEKLEAGIKHITPDALIVGERAERLPTTTAVIVPNISAETVLLALDMAGVCVSQGSACSSGKSVPSRVLMAHGFNESEALAGLRISTAWHNSEADINQFLDAYQKVMQRIKK